MKDVSVVIGANYGDEGKGLVTDYLANDSRKTVVVRFNGGAQAGHTVVTPEGYRHVFHHFGSGSFTLTPTFLSRFFLLNPPFFKKELTELKNMRLQPTVYVDPRCTISTPFDMMLNQAVEYQRGIKRHGSCGFGINETIERTKNIEFATPFGLMWMGGLKNRLKSIRDNYVPERMKALDLKDDNPFLHQLKDDLVIDLFLEDFKYMVDNIKVGAWEHAHKEWEKVVFEGAQGLHLDMESPEFPHVTRSRTGIHNVVELMSDIGRFSPLKVYYVSRTYFTRHGAGPLRREISWRPYYRIQDETNIPNPHQGSLRFSYLDLNDLMSFIKKDMKVSAAIQPKMVLTCCDQLENGKITYYENDRRDEVPVTDFAKEIIRQGMEDCLMSFGPTRSTIKSVRHL